MKELTDAIGKAAHDGELGTGADLGALRQAAWKWADHCLRTYDGDLLSKALKISEAIVNYANECERP